MRVIIGRCMSLVMVFLGAAVAHAPTTIAGETACPAGSQVTMITTYAEVSNIRGIANFQLSDSQTLMSSRQYLKEGRTEIAADTIVLPSHISRVTGHNAAPGSGLGIEPFGNAGLFYNCRFGVSSHFGCATSPTSSWDDVASRHVLHGLPRGATLISAFKIVRSATGYDDGFDREGVRLARSLSPTANADDTAFLSVLTGRWAMKEASPIASACPKTP